VDAKWFKANETKTLKALHPNDGPIAITLPFKNMSDQVTLFHVTAGSWLGCTLWSNAFDARMATCSSSPLSVQGFVCVYAMPCIGALMLRSRRGAPSQGLGDATWPTWLHGTPLGLRLPTHGQNIVASRLLQNTAVRPSDE
jgi:hypothetical protein